VTHRIVIDALSPSTPNGYPAKALAGRPVQVGATVFRDGHGVLMARARWHTVGHPSWRSQMLRLGFDDRFAGPVVFDAVGPGEIVIEAWTSRFATWRRDVERWMEGGEDIDGELLVGADLLDELRPLVPATDQARVAEGAAVLRDPSRSVRARLDAGFDDALVAVVDAVADPVDFTESAVVAVRVERIRAGVGAWYELFPRSEGGLKGATERLEDIAAMGFDVVYLPPIHPIGHANRKGRGNTETAEPGDVGSPWAIGSSDGGHTAVEPALGTLGDFDDFVARASELGLEVALDYALQCSPDHPWVTEHPEWFRRRADGSIRYAENPPKRYQDIVPLEFWPANPEERVALWQECWRILAFWVERGVRIFRVDNPHTKPVAFWEWLIPAIWERWPDVVFLSEAFTRPAMMHRLAEVGFSQSYTYFTWRDDAWEVRHYVEELATGPASGYLRPNFWPTTPDILPGVLRQGNRAAFELRATLAALLSPSFGIYSGYELMENEPASPDNEEFADSEKYRIIDRDWSRPDSLAPFLTRLNQIRRAHPDALVSPADVIFHQVDNERMLVWSVGSLLVVVNFDTGSAQEATVYLDLGSLGLAGGTDEFTVTDRLDETEPTHRWHGLANYVRLDPAQRAAHVFEVGSV
jgi:starch synthase (maltosyl-transferring)